jgi:hypothetical protein
MICLTLPAIPIIRRLLFIQLQLIVTSNACSLKARQLYTSSNIPTSVAVVTDSLLERGFILKASNTD